VPRVLTARFMHEINTLSRVKTDTALIRRRDFHLENEIPQTPPTHIRKITPLSWRVPSILFPQRLGPGTPALCGLRTSTGKASTGVWPLSASPRHRVSTGN
jgi:hypothetical protein